MDTGIMSKVIGIAIGLFVVAILVPMALIEIGEATWTGVDATVVTVVTVLVPVLAIIAVALYFLPKWRGA